MGAVQVLEQIERLGVKVEARGDKLVLEPASRIPAELLAQVREHKPEILTILSQAEIAHHRNFQEITSLMQPQGWALVWSDVLGESIAFAIYDAAAAQVPAGIIVYTREELALVIGAGADTLRLIHETKKHGGKVTGRSKADAV